MKTRENSMFGSFWAPSTHFTANSIFFLQNPSLFSASRFLSLSKFQKKLNNSVRIYVQTLSALLRVSQKFHRELLLTESFHLLEFSFLGVDSLYNWPIIYLAYMTNTLVTNTLRCKYWSKLFLHARFPQQLKPCRIAVEVKLDSATKNIA